MPLELVSANENARGRKGRKQKGFKRQLSDAERRRRRKLARRERELKKKAMRENIIIASIIVACVVVALYFWNPFDWHPGGIDSGAKVTKLAGTGEYLTIPVKTLEDGELHYYEYEGVKFYAHKNPWGHIRTRISSCEPCAGTTFTLVENGRIVDCDVCHTRWDSDYYRGIYPYEGEDRVGGCEDYPPPYLPNRIEGEYVVIKKSDILAFKSE